MPSNARALACLSCAALLTGCSQPARHDTRAALTPAPHPAPAPMAREPAPIPHGTTIIGRSVRGRPIEAVTLGDRGKRILIIGGIHGDEPEGGRTINATIAFLRALEPDARLCVVPDINPDGTAARTRTNARGVDLNRNWPASNYRPGGSRGPAPLSEPETRALHELLASFDPELVLVCHAASNGPFVNFDGPAASHAAAFAAAAAHTDDRWHVKPDMGYPTPGSLGTYIGIDRQTPILTLEFDRGHQPEPAWAAMRDGLAAILREPVLAN